MNQPDRPMMTKEGGIVPGGEGGLEPLPGEVTSLTATPPIPAANYELRILQSLRRILRAVETHSQVLAQHHHVTGPQLACLLAIREHGALTTCRLAQAVFLSPSTVVGIVDRLTDKGLLTRERGRRDRRQVVVTLTEKGQALTENAPSPLQETFAVALRQIPELERVTITLALERVVDLMDARGIDAAPILEAGPLAGNRPPP